MPITDLEKLEKDELKKSDFLLPYRREKQTQDLDIRQIIKEERKRESFRHTKRITLTSAQILALNGTPVTLIPAFLQSVIIVEGITARLNFNTTAYTGANNLEFRYTGAAGAKVTADIVNTFINSASTAYSSVAGIEAEITPVLNAPIVAVVPTANPATGNSTMDLFIRYRVITF